MDQAPNAGMTRANVIVGVVILAVLVFLILPTTTRHPSPALDCRNHLRQLGVALQCYIDGPGGGRFYPYPTQDGNYVVTSGADLKRGEGFSGASFLAALYWSGVLNEPSVFICPRSTDDNRGGRDLGRNPDDESNNRPGWNPSFEKPNGSHVSYASKAQWTMPRGEPLTKGSLPTDTVIASDDTDGRPNHDNGFILLYNDTHVEFLNTTRVESGDRGMVGNEPPLDMIGN